MNLTRRALLGSVAAGVTANAPFFLPGLAVAEARWPLPAADIPDTPLGKQLSWTLDQINGEAVELSVRDLQRHFTPEFLAALPADQLLAIFKTYLVPNAPMAAARFEGSAAGSRARVIVTTPGRDWRITIGVDTGDGTINELFFEPAPLPASLPKPIANWKSLKRSLDGIAPRVSFLAAEIVDGELTLIDSLTLDRTLGVGSSFKLYVLAELARQIETGKASWDEPLSIRDDLRSLPNGDMRLEPAGATFPISTFADQMISASDNTATDHLITRLGRERVEEAFADFGNARPGRNIPLLLTREWFAIKLRLTRPEIDAYLAADVATKRAILANRVDPEALTLTEDEEWRGSYYIEEIEWFASAADLCRVMATLHRQAEKPDFKRVHEALSINPGIPFDARTWAFVGYKGGYETGVKSDVWLLKRGDGRWFVVSAIINDERAEIDGIGLWQLMIPAVNLLAEIE